MVPLRCGLITSKGAKRGLATPFVDGFAENGCDVLVASQQSIWNFDECDFVMTHGPMKSMAWVISRLSKMRRVPPLIVWFTEQVPQPDFPTLAVHLAAKLRYSLERYSHSRPIPYWLRNQKIVSALFSRAGRFRALGEMLALKQQNMLNLICVFTNTGLHVLQRHGLPVALVPMGYHPSFGERLALERDIDVVFLGSTRDKRRKRFIGKLEERLSTRGITFVIKDGTPKRGYAFGRERTILLNRTKIMLNIMRQAWDDPVFRLLLAAPNGAMLLSEKLLPTSTGPFCPGEHFAMADLADIADAIEYYLDRREERQRIAEHAYEFVTTELTMGKMAQEVLHTLGV